MGFTLPLIPVFVFNYFTYKNQVSALVAIFRPWLLAVSHQSNIVHQISNLLNNLLYYPQELILQNPLLIFFFAGFILLFKNKKCLLLNVIFILTLTYFTYIINKQLRFSLVFLPLLCFYAAYGIMKIYTFFSTFNKHKKYVKYTFLIILLLFTIFSLYIIFPQHIDSLNFFDRTEPKIVSGYYNLNYTGTFLTTDPVFSAYNNNLFVPFYNNVYDAFEGYIYNLNDVDGVIYDSEFYPCFGEDENECELVKEQLFKKINEENTMVYNQTWYGVERYMFVR